MAGQATPIGTNVVNSISRRYIMPDITDQIYNSNAVFYRINQSNKRIIRGGFQIETPLMYSKFITGGPYEGFDVLDVAPSDTVKNGAWQWRQQYVNVTVDGLTLIKTDSPEAIANFLQMYFAQAEMQMSDNLGTGLWSSGTNTKQIDGLGMAVDDGGVTATYGGITRASNTWWNAVLSSTATMTLSLLQTMWGNTQYGGRHTTLIASRQEQYNRYWALSAGGGTNGIQRFPVGPGGHDEQLASAGFTNLLFNNAPWIIDSHVPDGPNSSNSAVYFLNEDYIWLAVSPRADFWMEDFQTPVNQDAMVAKLLWAGNLVVTNCKSQGKLTGITG